MALRQANQKELTLKESDIDKLRERIAQTKKLLDGKRKDPSKQQKIALFKKQIEEKQRQIEEKHNDIVTQKTVLHYLKDVCNQLENKKLGLVASLEKHDADEEDQDFLISRVEQSFESIRGLKDQQAKLTKMIQKK